MQLPYRANRPLNALSLSIFPKEGAKSIGFVTGVSECGDGKRISVFIPTIPNPTTGFLIFVDESAVTNTNLTVEDAFKTLFSAWCVDAGKCICGVQNKYYPKSQSGNFITALQQYNSKTGAHVGWCRRRTSNPVCPAFSGIGGFDSHTLPPIFKVAQASSRRASFICLSL